MQTFPPDLTVYYQVFTTTVFGRYPKYPDPPRPSMLLKAQDDLANGAITEKDYEKTIERVTVEAVGEMLAAGVEIVSDAQIRWHNDYSYIFQQLNGFESADEEDSSNGKGPLKPLLTGKIGWRKPIITGDYKFLSERLPENVRPSLTGPFSLALMCREGIYENRLDDITNEIAAALNRELQGLQAAGAKFVLIEEPLLALSLGNCSDLPNNKYISLLRSENSDSIKETDRFAASAEILCQSIDAEIVLGTSFGDIVSISDLIAQTAYHGVAIDLINGPQNIELLKSGSEWQGKLIQVGIIDAQSEEVEKIKDIAEALVEFAEYHDPDLIWVSPNSGLDLISRSAAFDKLSNMYKGVTLARKIVASREKPQGEAPD